LALDPAPEVIAGSPGDSSHHLQPYLRTSAAAQAEFDLAITIPTYNRAEQLAALLGQLAQEAEGLSDRVVIVVSNNCSTDDTDAVISDYAGRHSQLAFEAYRQERNIGPIPNIHFLVSVARARWVWCLGDDDLLFDGALRTVLASLDVNSDDLRLLRTRGIGEWDAIAEVGGIRRVGAVTKEGAAFLMAAGFLASALLRAATWRRLIAPASAFGAPNYANWVAVLLAVAETETITVVDTPCVRGNATMVGEVRFAKYPVLVLQRLLIWRTLWNRGGVLRRMATVLRPQIARLFRRQWRSIAAGVDQSLPSRGEKWSGFLDGARLLRWSAMGALPWLAIALVVSEGLRSRAGRFCRRLLRGS
jgi:glycosyltransferase involved in cell wall biosynthesis